MPVFARLWPVRVWVSFTTGAVRSALLATAGLLVLFLPLDTVIDWQIHTASVEGRVLLEGTPLPRHIDSAIAYMAYLPRCHSNEFMTINL